MPAGVAIVGVGLSKTARRRDDVTHPELALEAVWGALEHANLTIDEIEAVAYGCMDPFDGIVNPDRWDADACGVASDFKPYMKISTGGTTGASTAFAAYYHVASGLFDTAMAVAVQRVGECAEAQPVLNTCLCPYYERYTGFGAISNGAAQAIAHMHKYGSTEEQLAHIASQMHENALRNPFAHLRFKLSVDDALKARYVVWPLRLSDCCPSTDGACAVVFASGERARKITDNPVWVRGCGSITDGYFLGNKKDLADWYNLSILGRRVYKQAGIGDPKKEIKVAELYSAFTPQQILEVEALGFCGKGEGGKLAEEGVTAFRGDLPVCPSGGVLCTNPIAATSLIRIAEAALQVRGEADKRQVPNADTAVAHGWGGMLQFHTLMILSENKR